ncbi:LysR family transcriptional regulator [Liquorilactobacillus satsumensis]|uniref:LysR family transcriptional regulator n=1 Tax=Liquorilactobacillus TaxID=2767888 RepID=UPI0021C3A50C|nr:LysR family transcriptional regulator [Liquorilactobacillus satsumensis]MCP9313748.1 LysR family transcriptional regulator [Liquorilactobacillus satsumensis]MCP9360889.1 LysR family transcriptional regulator [Liquorilactobacillus satsumensis]
MNRFLILQKIIELGSFTKAAKVLGYTQSSISQMVASLEDELSIKLLNRSRTGITLTLEGQELYPLIQQTIRQYQAVQERATEIKGLKTGIIRIGTISSITVHWLPKLIKQFKIKYPNVEFILYQGDYNSIADWIKTNTVDFGFTTPPMATEFKTIPIKQGEMLAVLPKDHPMAKQPDKPLDLRTIKNDPLILLEEGQYSEPLNAFAAANIKPNIKYRIHDDYAIMTMVEAGLGVSILAELVLQRMPFNIITRPLVPPIRREIAIAYKDKQRLPIASQYFIQEISKNKHTLF